MSTFGEAMRSRPIVLDGGLATTLEARGNDLSSALWSARLLTDAPEEISAVHDDFFAAGAQVATSASYQASFEGFARLGLDRDAATALMRRSVSLARQAAERASERDGRPRWVAASVGPYGAALADGSEYRGDYGLSVDELRRWHRPRLQVLLDAGADVLALETVPCAAEVEALLAEISGTGAPAWLSLTPDAGRTRAGEPLAETYAMAADVQEVLAVGANCFDPADATAMIRTAARSSGKPVVLYPNSGEGWDAERRGWTGGGSFHPEDVRGWLADGARLVGGCCRVGPEQIRSLSGFLAQDSG